MFSKKARNVDTIVRDLGTMVAELLNFEQEQNKEAARQQEIMDKAEAFRNAATLEANRASNVAEKIGDLIA